MSAYNIIAADNQSTVVSEYTFSDDEWSRFFRECVAGANDGIVGKTRYDVTVLVNGLPLAHIELKRRGVAIREAFNQIKRYQRDSFWAGGIPSGTSGLFEYVRIFVISNGTHTKYYSNTTRNQHIKEMGGDGHSCHAQSRKKTSNSKEILAAIDKAVNSSLELRGKKDLIEGFVSRINTSAQVDEDWIKFVAEQKEKDLAALIVGENLKDSETRKFVENSFRDGSLKTIGTDVDKIMPPVLRFGGGNRTEKKQGIIDKLMSFFEKYLGLV